MFVFCIVVSTEVLQRWLKAGLKVAPIDIRMGGAPSEIIYTIALLLRNGWQGRR